MPQAIRAGQIGGRLSEARQASGLTLRALAEAADVGYVTISDIEKDKYVPRTDTVEKLAYALGVSPSWLAYGMGPREEKSGRK